MSAGRSSAEGRASYSRARGPGFNTQSGNILSFLFPLIQEGQFSVTSKCAQSAGSLWRYMPPQEKVLVRLTDSSDMTITVYHGIDVKLQHNNNNKLMICLWFVSSGTSFAPMLFSLLSSHLVLSQDIILYYAFAYRPMGAWKSFTWTQ